MTTTSMNDFKIEKVLGKGSFGSVYLVTRKEDHKIYALKSVIMDKLKKKEQENSVNEVRILASVNHPNVIGYKEAFWDDKNSTLNIVMEYADDGDLQTKIQKMKKENGFFNESLIWSYSIQMIEGLKALHDKKIMHRDLKSANIFLVKNKHQCKIGDMNVSKVIKEKVLLTQTGTPYYASPEVWKDSPYSYKSDLWSIGCVIYELCALKPPFGGKDLDELFVNVCKGKPQRINYIYSDDLWKMILLLLQVDVNKRVNCDEFLNHPLILKKMKEMKNDNSDFKSLEDNKNIHEGVLLKTIQFKDLRDIKSQLPTKKNYDKIPRGNSFSDGKNVNIMFSGARNKSNPNIFIKNNSLIKNNKNNVGKNIKNNSINNMSVNNKNVNIVNNENINNNNNDYNKKKEIYDSKSSINQYNYINRNPDLMKDNCKISLTSETKSGQHIILTDIDGNKECRMNKINSLKKEKQELMKKFKIELDNNKKESSHKSSKDINIINSKEIERNKIRERIKEYENKLKLREEEKQKQKQKNKNSTELYNFTNQNNTNNYDYINNKYLEIINNFCKNINYNFDNHNLNSNNNLNDNNDNLEKTKIINENKYTKNISHNSVNDININNRKKQISSARVNSGFNLPITKINNYSNSREKLGTDVNSNEHILPNKKSVLITEGVRAKSPSSFFTKISGRSGTNTAKNRDNINYNNYANNYRSEIINLNNNCLTSISKDNIFNKYYNNNILKNNNNSNNTSKITNNDNNSLANHRSNTLSSINNMVNKRVTKKIVTYERKHKSTNKIDSMRPSSAAPSKRILEFNQHKNNNYDYSNVSHQLQKYSYFNKDFFINNNKNINKTNNSSKNIKNYSSDKPKLTVENHIINYNNKYNTSNNNITHKKINNCNSSSYINKKNSVTKINGRANSYKNHEKDFFSKKRENNNRDRDLTEPDLSPINNRLKNIKNDNSKLNFSMFNSGITSIIGKNSFLHDNSKIGYDYYNNGIISNKINKISEKQYYAPSMNSQQIFNNFYSINTINSTNAPIKVVNVFNNK